MAPPPPYPGCYLHVCTCTHNMTPQAAFYILHSAFCILLASSLRSQETPVQEPLPPIPHSPFPTGDDLILLPSLANPTTSADLIGPNMLRSAVPCLHSYTPSHRSFFTPAHMQTCSSKNGTLCIKRKEKRRLSFVLQ